MKSTFLRFFKKTFNLPFNPLMRFSVHSWMMPLVFSVLLCVPCFHADAVGAVDTVTAKGKTSQKKSARSLLCEQLHQRAQELTSTLPKKPRCITPPITDRRFWDKKAAEPGFQRNIHMAEKNLNTPIPGPADDLYLEYSKNGNRTRWQTYTNRRYGLFKVFLSAELAENKGRFLPKIEAYIQNILEDRSWTLSAHDRNLSTFHNTEITIDLRSSQLAWEMSCVLACFGEKLASPTRQRIREELERRCFQPYENAIKTGKPQLWWITSTNNWNAVCLAGVTGAALSGIESRERRAWYVAAAEHFITYSEKGYTDDGYCSEGLGYWCYGFGNHIRLAELLRRATGGTVAIMDREHIRNVALYGTRIEILPGISPAFADCAVNASPASSILYILNAYYGWKLPRNLYAPVASALDITDVGIFEQIDFSSIGKVKKEAYQPAIRDWFPNAQVLICRPDNWVGKKAADVETLCVAMKGGHNAEHHNHNDLGSYVVVWRGYTPLLDLGSEVYTKRTFSSQRYLSDVLNSWGHPVPFPAGKMQETGRAFHANVLKSDFTPEQDTLCLDLNNAYQDESIKKLVRTFIYNRKGKGSFTIQDDVQFTSPQSFSSPLVTTSQWKLENDRILFTPHSKNFNSDYVVQAQITVMADGNKTNKWHVEESRYNADFAQKKNARRLGIILDVPVSKAQIKVTVTPGK